MKEITKENEKFLLSNMSKEIDLEKKLSTTDDNIKKYHNLNRYFVNHKNTSNFKLKLVRDIHFIEKKIKIFTFIKFLLGFILLAIPLFIIIYFIISDYNIMSQYIFYLIFYH